MHPVSSSAFKARLTLDSLVCASAIRVSTVGHALRPSGWQRSARAMSTSLAVAVGAGASLSAHDVHCQLMVLPLSFRVPSCVPA